jgi:hypothetical protein
MGGFGRFRRRLVHVESQTSNETLLLRHTVHPVHIPRREGRRHEFHQRGRGPSVGEALQGDPIADGGSSRRDHPWRQLEDAVRAADERHEAAPGG